MSLILVQIYDQAFVKQLVHHRLLIVSIKLEESINTAPNLMLSEIRDGDNLMFFSFDNFKHDVYVLSDNKQDVGMLSEIQQDVCMLADEKLLVCK